MNDGILEHLAGAALCKYRQAMKRAEYSFGCAEFYRTQPTMKVNYRLASARADRTYAEARREADLYLQYKNAAQLCIPACELLRNDQL